MELNEGLKVISWVCELSFPGSRREPWPLTCHNRLSNTSRKKKKNSTMKRHIMFLETLTWRQITDLFKKVFQKNIKNSLSWQGERGQVVYRSWPVPFSLNIHVQTETNWDCKSKHKSVWGSCWLSQWNKTRLSTTVHLQETVMTGRTKEKTHAHTHKKRPKYNSVLWTGVLLLTSLL